MQENKEGMGIGSSRKKRLACDRGGRKVRGLGIHENLLRMETKAWGRSSR